MADIVADSNVSIDTLIEEQQWEQVRQRFEAHPEEATKMVNPNRGWTKLHWLCSLGSAPSSLIDLVASLYPQAICMPENRYGDTPLHLACRNAQVTIKKPKYLLNRLRLYQEQQQQEAEAEGDNNDNNETSESDELQGVLIRNRFGGTALHSACNHNAMLDVLQTLVEANHRVVGVTTFDGIHPVSALYTSYIQTIPGYMAVARTLKGEDMRSGSSHFHRFWQKVVYLTTCDRQDERVADPSRLVLHGLLCSGHLLINFFLLALKHDPSLATVADQEGDLALHLLVNRRPFRLKEREAIEATLAASKRGVAVRNRAGDLPLLAGIRNKIPWHNGLDLLVQADPTTAQRRDVTTNLLPFQLAASVDGKVAFDTTFRLLTIQPDLLFS